MDSIKTKVFLAPMFTSRDGYAENCVKYLCGKDFESKIFTVQLAQESNEINDRYFQKEGLGVEKGDRTREGFLNRFFEKFIVENNAVYIALIDGYIEGYDYGGCLNENKFLLYRKGNKRNVYVKSCDQERTFEELQKNGMYQISSRHSIYFLSMDAWKRISDKPNFNILNYILIAIYRDLVRYLCQKSLAFDYGNRRCIFTKSTFDRIEDCIYAIRYPIISRRAKIEIYKSLMQRKSNTHTFLEHNKLRKKKKDIKEFLLNLLREIKKLRPFLFKDRLVIKFQADPVNSWLGAFSVALVAGILSGITVEFITNFIANCCCK